MSDASSPRYTDPQSVLSPKGSIENLHVLADTGEDGYAVASMLWYGQDSLGLRWNGNATNPIGNPQSRGIPTWFIVPEPLAVPLRNRFAGTFAAFSAQNMGITRVRIRPLPHRIWEGKPQESSDDTWVLSITDQAQGQMEIMNPRTGHFMALHMSQVKSLVRDTVADAPNGPKHGIMNLNIQMIFEDGKLRIEPLQPLTDRLESLSRDLQKTGYDGRHDDVSTLIREIRRALTGPTGEIGAWEEHELDYADTAVTDNFLQLALSSAAKAIMVNRLPPDDYEHGFKYERNASSRAIHR